MPVDHDRLKDRLWLLYDGELGEPERREVMAHLEACSECRETSARWGRIAGALLAPPHVQPSEQFVRRVMARVAEAQAEPLWLGAWRLRWLMPALGAGLAAATLLVFNLAAWPDLPVSTDGLLLADATGAQANGRLSNGEAQEDDLTVLLLEE